MSVKLTEGAIQRMVQSAESKDDPSFHPVLQIIRVMEVSSAGNAQKRYRAIFSDGNFLCQGMLATQNNHLVESDQLTNHSVVRVNTFLLNDVQGKTIVILIGFEVLDNPGEKIGNPTSVDKAPTLNSYGGGNGDVKPEPQAVRSGGNNPYNSSPSNPYARNNNNNANANASTSSSSNPIMRTNTSSSGKHITPISALNLYQNRWTIKARLTNKGDVRHWSNAKGDGSLFSIEMLDSSGTDIRATFFREAVEKFHPMLECDKVYTFTGGKLKVANLQYNTCKSSFEITFDQNAEIVLESDDGQITQQLYEFQPIANLEQVDPGKYVDIIGVVKNVGEPGTIVSKKTGKELNKCELTIVDDSGAEVSCTVWGERAMQAQSEFENTPVVALRRARVSDYGGRTLSASGGNGININPRVPEAQRIGSWWQSGGSTGAVKRLTSAGGGANRFPEFDTRKSVSAIKGENMGYNSTEKPDWVSFKGTVSFIKSDREGGAWYPACFNANEPCKNRFKVAQGGDGTWFCDKCNQSYQECLYRFIFSATISDATATTWVSIFDDQAQVLLDGVLANDLQKIYADGDVSSQEAYDAVFNKATFTDWVFTCKVKQEMVQDEMRIKTSIQSMHKMDYAKEGRSLLNAVLAM
mmetsp:Transcript_5408/g.8036  ORF Transcript_5408/g.8036 Transcript_5408/m.8036 type:complete len:638 (-) Transcript_5408:183-2096(-)